MPQPRQQGLKDTGLSQGDALYRSRQEGKFPKIGHLPVQRTVMDNYAPKGIRVCVGWEGHRGHETWTLEEHGVLQIA